MFELCTWRFIENRYAPISEHESEEAAYAAQRREWARREKDGQYTDVGTFKVREKVAA